MVNNQYDLYGTYGGSEKVEVYKSPENKIIKKIFGLGDISVDLLIDNYNVYILGFDYLSDSNNFSVMKYDLKLDKMESFVEFTSKEIVPWYYNDLYINLNNEIVIRCSDKVHYFTKNLKYIDSYKINTSDTICPKINLLETKSSLQNFIEKSSESLSKFLMNYENSFEDFVTQISWCKIPETSDTILCSSDGEVYSAKSGYIIDKNENDYEDLSNYVSTQLNDFDKFNMRIFKEGNNSIVINDTLNDLNEFKNSVAFLILKNSCLIFGTYNSIKYQDEYNLPFRFNKLKKKRIYFFNKHLGLMIIDKFKRFQDPNKFLNLGNIVITLNLNGILKKYRINNKNIKRVKYNLQNSINVNGSIHTFDMMTNINDDTTLSITTNKGLILEFDFNSLEYLKSNETPENWTQEIKKWNDSIYCMISNFHNYYYFNKISKRMILKRIRLSNENYIIQLPNSPYYSCSKDASKMLHYVTPSLKVIGFDQLDPVYNRPDIVLDSISRHFANVNNELIASYRQAWEKRVYRLGLDKDKIGNEEIAVPDAHILNIDSIDYLNSTGSIDVSINAQDSKYALRRMNVIVNEVPMYGSEGISLSSKNLMNWDSTITVKLTEGENKIQVSVMNELGLENFKYPTYVNYNPKEKIVSKTYFVGIGVNKFKEEKFNLKYCVRDIDSMNNVLSTNSDVVSILLKDDQVSVDKVKEIREVLMQTTEQDKVIIACSSHGVLDERNNFYLAMHDMEFNNPSKNGLPYEELEYLLDGIPARKKLMLLDACNSGLNEIEDKEEDNDQLALNKEVQTNGNTKGFTINQPKKREVQKSSFETMMELFVNVNNSTGSVILSAAGGKESALEAIEVDGKIIENGAFTYSILEYINKNEEISINELKKYVERRVVEITNGRQKPTSRQESMEVDWMLLK